MKKMIVLFLFLTQSVWASKTEPLLCNSVDAKKDLIRVEFYPSQILGDDEKTVVDERMLLKITLVGTKKITFLGPEEYRLNKSQTKLKDLKHKINYDNCEEESTAFLPQ